MVQMLERKPDTDEYRTIHICAGDSCGAALYLAEDVILLQVVLPQQIENQVVYVPFTSNGTYAYEPYFMHEHCWQEYYESLHEFLQDLDVQVVEDPYSSLLCEACGSSIRFGEPSCLVSFGLLEANKRNPDNKQSVTYHTNETQLLCLSCIRTFNEEVLELWESGISYYGECAMCTHERVWRTNEVCQHPKDDDDEEEDEFGDEDNYEDSYVDPVVLAGIYERQSSG